MCYYRTTMTASSSQSSTTKVTVTSSSSSQASSSSSLSMSSIKHNNMVPLSKSYIPASCDVIVYASTSTLTKHQIRQHNGNQRYRSILRLAVPKYTRANTKFQKWHLINQIVTAIQKLATNSNNGSGPSTTMVTGFIAQDHVTGRWYSVGEKLIHEIVEENLHSEVLKSQRRRMARRNSGSSVSSTSSTNSLNNSMMTTIMNNSHNTASSTNTNTTSSTSSSTPPGTEQQQQQQQQYRAGHKVYCVSN